MTPPPNWSTASFGNTADTSPAELSALGAHLQNCRGLSGRWFTLQCGGDALHRFLGARIRITRFAEDSLHDVQAEQLAVIAPPMPIDNFEAVSAARAPDGTVRLYILSDDNFSKRQRTLLFAFDVV